MKTVDRAADLGERMKKALVRTADQAQNLTDDGQVTPSEYAGDKLQYGMEDIASEAGHIVVDTGKGAYHACGIDRGFLLRYLLFQRRYRLTNDHEKCSPGDQYGLSIVFGYDPEHDRTR